MIQAIGQIVGIHALARLIQVPIENSNSKGRWAGLLLVSIIACLEIAGLLLNLLLSGSTQSAGIP